MTGILPDELFKRNKHISFRHRLGLAMKFYLTSFAIESPHAQYEIISFANGREGCGLRATVSRICVSVPDLSPELEGCIVEAGCFKGGSAAKFSLIAEKLGRPLIVFDSTGPAKSPPGSSLHAFPRLARSQREHEVQG